MSNNPAKDSPKQASFPSDPFLGTILSEVGRSGSYTASSQRLAELFGDDGPAAWAAKQGMDVSYDGDEWTTFKRKAAKK